MRPSHRHPARLLLGLFLALLLSLSTSPARAHGAPLRAHVTLMPASPQAGKPATLAVTVRDTLGGAVSGLKASVQVETEEGKVKQRAGLTETAAESGIYQGVVTLPAAGTWVLEIDLPYLDELQQTFITTTAGQDAPSAGAQNQWDVTMSIRPLPTFPWRSTLLYSGMGAALLLIATLLVRAYRR